MRRVLEAILAYFFIYRFSRVQSINKSTLGVPLENSHNTSCAFVKFLVTQSYDEISKNEKKIVYDFPDKIGPSETVSQTSRAFIDNRLILIFLIVLYNYYLLFIIFYGSQIICIITHVN